jgi:deoxyhypusine synthase
MDLKKKIKKAKELVFKQAEQVKGVEIKGPNFDKDLDLKKLINSYKGIGFQASNLYNAIEIIKKMRQEKATIFLAYTSGIISSGLRDIIKYLVEKRLVHVLITTTGGIEEDLIKCMKPFILGKFNAEGKMLRKKGINRIGNIFVPNDRYVRFEEWINPVLEEIFKEQKSGKIITPSYLVKKLGEKINCKDSVYYHAWKNNIPVFVPAPLDGSLGDMIYFFKQKHKEFQIDVTGDLKKLIDFTIQQEKTGLIVLGGGVIKHSVCNANLFRDGADYAVYINAAQEFDGSDAGATPDEAVSWGKIKGKKEQDNIVKVYSDATLVFPLIVMGGFVENSSSNSRKKP